MPDWTKSMSQSFEFYTVDPITWMNSKLLDNVKSCSITRDSTTNLLASATIDIEDMAKEEYIRPYLVTIQNGITEKFPLGTYLVQTPSLSYDGKVQSISLDAYSPLIELKDDMPPIGYMIHKNTNIMEAVGNLTKGAIRSPVVFASDEILLNEDFVADTSESWLDFLQTLAANANYIFDLDEYDRIIFNKYQLVDEMTPKWTYTADNSSILYPDINLSRDLYGVPNVVEVVYSGNEGTFYAEVTNDDVNSPISTVNRGRIVRYRDTNPSITGRATQEVIEEYASKLLKSLSALEFTITYKHGYCPVRVGDCVRLNYEASGINNVKAKVISQQITCDLGCQVQETAKFTSKLWGE